MRRALTILLVAVGVAGCSNTRGSWSCGADRGVPCQSIADLDRREPRSAAPATPIQGGSAVRWWSTTDAVAGAFDAAPRREPDQVVRVLIGGWTDATGDFHAPSEIYAVMRRGGWWAPPPAAPLTPPKPATTQAQASAASQTPPPPQGDKGAAPADRAGVAPEASR